LTDARYSIQMMLLRRADPERGFSLGLMPRKESAGGLKARKIDFRSFFRPSAVVLHLREALGVQRPSYGPFWRVLPIGKAAPESYPAAVS
jgi:hypothetical protein